MALDPASVLPSAAQAERSRPQWLVAPWFDLLFVINAAWPLIVLWQSDEGFAGRAGVQFWQIYFVTTPHRWITLGLVFLDRERFRAQRGLFLGVAAAVIVFCSGIRIATGALTCLLAVDYLWNAWHFAAQHHGVSRIYARRAGSTVPAGWDSDKWLMRAFLVYVAFRVAGTTWSQPAIHAGLLALDWAVLAAPLWLLGRRLAGLRDGSQGEMLYLLSVFSLYVGLLGTAHWRQPAAMLGLATASALFHATEYLAVVGWSVQRRAGERGSAMGLLGWLAPRWGLTLGGFVLVLGSVGWLMERDWLEAWLFLNVIVAFLHYAYDGLIWRSPRSAAAPAG